MQLLLLRLAIATIFCCLLNWDTLIVGFVKAMVLYVKEKKVGAGGCGRGWGGGMGGP